MLLSPDTDQLALPALRRWALRANAVARLCFAVAFGSVLFCPSPALAADRSVQPIISRIQRQAVDSSALAAIGYSKRLEALEIEFRDGLIYRYTGVPLRMYRELISAESKARFYNKNIRGKYYCVRVKPPRKR